MEDKIALRRKLNQMYIDALIKEKGCHNYDCALKKEYICSGSHRNTTEQYEQYGCYCHVWKLNDLNVRKSYKETLV